MIARFREFGKKPLCNLKCERAPKIFGFVFPLCYRCSGLIIGGISAYMIRLPVVLSILFMFPMLVDVLIQYSGKIESSNFRRITSGFLFGIGLNILR